MIGGEKESSLQAEDFKEGDIVEVGSKMKLSGLPNEHCQQQSFIGQQRGLYY